MKLQPKLQQHKPFEEVKYKSRKPERVNLQMRYKYIKVKQKESAFKNLSVLKIYPLLT